MIHIILVKHIIENLVEYVYQDLKNKSSEDTFLYKLLYGCKDSNFDFYEQACALFSRGKNNPMKVGVLLEYPKDKTSLPAYVIREPGKIKGEANNIGKIDGLYPKTSAYKYNDSRASTYNIMCFANNMSESILLSEVLYALLLASYDNLSNEFDSIEFGMKELMLGNEEVIPYPIFMKSLELSISSRIYVSGLIDPILLGKVLFEDAGVSAYDFVAGTINGSNVAQIQTGFNINIILNVYRLNGFIKVPEDLASANVIVLIRSEKTGEEVVFDYEKDFNKIDISIFSYSYSNIGFYTLSLSISKADLNFNQEFIAFEIIDYFEGEKGTKTLSFENIIPQSSILTNSFPYVLPFKFE